MDSKVPAYHRWLHRYAILVACSTFLLILAGALVTSNDAGLSVPDWPTSFGSFHMPRMVGGVLYEHGHRMIAGTVATLTVILALWLWFVEERRWLRWMGVWAVLAVVAQALLGGLTVLLYLPPPVSAGHATLAQIFFCINSSIAFFTGKRWTWDEPKMQDESSPSVQNLAAATTGAILIQLVLGALYRHSGLGVVPHILGACVVAALVIWLETKILLKHSNVRELVKPAVLMVVLLVGQVSLGIVAYAIKLADKGAPQPLPPFVDTTTAHVAVGAALLLTSLYLTYQTHRFLASPHSEEKFVTTPHKATL